MRSGHFFRIALMFAYASPLASQQQAAKALLDRALHFPDLYNWTEAAPFFTRAEQIYVESGDQRNALYARLGRIRSNVERDQQSLPAMSA